MASQNIIIGADHAGFALKNACKEFLTGMGYVVTDAGPQNEEPVDYPDFGIAVARAISARKFDRGILICASGIGMSIVANKFPGVRAALCLDADMARLSRLHNNANILVLAGRKTDKESARRIVEVWLSTLFEGGRHEKRLAKIDDLEGSLYACPISE
jgi:ribose 5-phosphate isomerase B